MLLPGVGLLLSVDSVRGFGIRDKGLWILSRFEAAGTVHWSWQIQHMRDCNSAAGTHWAAFGRTDKLPESMNNAKLPENS